MNASRTAADQKAAYCRRMPAAGRSRRFYRKVDHEGFRLCGIALAEHTLGHAKESQQALDEMIAKHAQAWAYRIAEVYAWRGEKDQAFEWLERAYRQRNSGLAGVKIDLLLESLHGDPRFTALLMKMNFPE